MSLKTISPVEARRLIAEGAVLVDIRGTDEHARERIDGSRNHPLDRLAMVDSDGRPVLFHCKSGSRTAVHATKLAAATSCEAYIVEGGIDGWKKAGLPVIADRRQPLELQRQVQITAGSLVLLGIALSVLVDPRWIGLAAVVGAGLAYAGITGWCGMAKLFALMPWNARSRVA
ncbi:MAG: rhodanese family protein [Hyphomicrobium sp.]